MIKIKRSYNSLKRSDFGGFTLRIGQWWIELVTIKHIPQGVTISNRHGRHNVRRIEFWKIEYF